MKLTFFRYIFRITCTFLNSTCLLLAIFLRITFNQKGKRAFISPKTFFISVTFDFLFRKKRCSLKITSREFSTCLLLATFLKFIFNQRKTWLYFAQNFRFFISKTFNFLFRKKSYSLKIAVPEFQNYIEITFNFSKII